MKCFDVEKNLDSLIECGSDYSLGSEAQKHLTECLSCNRSFETLQTISMVLKETLPVSAPVSLDEKVMRAFQVHQNKRREMENQSVVGRSFFNFFAISKPAFALAVLVLVASTILAFQIGKMTAPSVPLSAPQTETSGQNQMANNSEALAPSKTENDTGGETPVRVRIVRIPAVKEKIVTRYVYATRKSGGDKRTRPAQSPKFADYALDRSLRKNGYLTQTNLKGFQPVSELKIKVISKEENNE